MVLPSSAMATMLLKQFKFWFCFFLQQNWTNFCQSIHKEKLNVPISAEHHKELNSFRHHLHDFTGLLLRPSIKERFENYACTSTVHKAVGGSVGTFLLKTDSLPDVWEHNMEGRSHGK